MKTPNDRKYNLKILAMVTPHIKNLEYCIFFGTLLGYHREGNLLEKDDDVDVYLNVKHRNKLIEILNSLDIETTILNPVFIQGSIKVDNIQVYIDFYLYLIHGNKIVDRWNFGGQMHNNESDLHIPCHFILPTKEGSIRDVHFKVPNHPEACCKFLYGKDYMIPKEKKKDYYIRIVGHMPKLFKFDPNVPASPLPKKKGNR